jgi:hypothetical protein
MIAGTAVAKKIEIAFIPTHLLAFLMKVNRSRR